MIKGTVLMPGSKAYTDYERRETAIEQYPAQGLACREGVSKVSAPVELEEFLSALK